MSDPTVAGGFNPRLAVTRSSDRLAGTVLVGRRTLWRPWLGYPFRRTHRAVAVFSCRYSPRYC